MKLTNFLLGFPKPDCIAFHQVCNVWTMTIPTSARWFNLCYEAQRADGSLNKLKSIQNGAHQGQQLARNCNNDGGARRRDHGVLAHPHDRASTVMEEATVTRVARTLSVKSRRRNVRNNRQDSGRLTWRKQPPLRQRQSPRRPRLPRRPPLRDPALPSLQSQQQRP